MEKGGTKRACCRQQNVFDDFAYAAKYLHSKEIVHPIQRLR